MIRCPDPRYPIVHTLAQLLVRRMSFALLLASAALAVLPGVSRAQEAALRFGVLPLGGALESRQDWKPLLDDMGASVSRPVVALSFTSYEGLRLAMQENRVDLAFVSGKLALEALRKDGPIQTLDDVLNQPGKWRLGMGETQSMSGYVIPQLQLFAPRGIAIERHFPSELVDGHQGTALAVANGDVDVATNNTADLDRFRTHFPQEAARLKIIWESDLIPHGAIVMQRGFPDAMRDKVRAFLSGYGHGTGARADTERVVLSRLHGLAGFPTADNRMLLQVLRLEYQLSQRQALQGQWVSEQARQSRLARLAAEYEDQRQRLAVAPAP